MSDRISPLDPIRAKVCNSNNDSLKTESEEWLTTNEAAEYLRTSPQNILNLCNNGKLPYYKFGRRNMYLKSELRDQLLANKRGVLNGS